MDIIAILGEKEDQEIIKTLSSIFDKQKINSICDYGCGDGRILRQIKEKLSAEICYTGVDFWSNKHNTKSKPENEKSINYMDNGDPGFDDFINNNKFDLVFSTYALHHFRLPIQELKHMEDLLAREGILVIIDIYRDYTSGENIVDNVAFFNDQMMLKAFKGLYHRIPYTQSETRDLLLALNVDIVKQDIVELDLTDQEIEEFKAAIPKIREKSAQEEHQDDQSKNRDPVFLDVQKTVQQMVTTLGKKYGATPDKLLITVAKKRN